MKKKYSQFNVFYKEDNQFIGFNTFNQEIIVLEELLFDLISTKDAPSYLKVIHPEFYDFLQKKGFIVNQSLDELEEVRKLMHSIDFDETSYELTINPTMNCNFKCWYCYESHITQSSMSDDIKNRIIKHIELITTNSQIKNVHFSWFGGEPLLEYEIIKSLIKRTVVITNKKGISFTSAFTTNGLLISDDMIQFFKDNYINNFQITLDGHKNTHNEVRYISKNKGSYERIINNIKLLIKNKFYVSIRINYSEETIINLNKIADDFSDIVKKYNKFFSFGFHKVWQSKIEDVNSIEKHLNYFRDKGFSISTKSDNDTVRNSCYADKKNHATINYNGDVFKCTARDFKSSNKEGVLDKNGVIIWNDKYTKRMNIKLTNKPCFTCKILPVCGGGCTQNSLENLKNSKEYCIYNYDENKKIEFIKDKLQAVYNEV